MQILTKLGKLYVRDFAFCQDYPTTPLTATTADGSYALIWYGEDKTNIPGDTSATYTAPPSDSVDFDVFIKDTPDGPAVTEP
eukprot:gene39560-48876_t